MTSKMLDVVVGKNMIMGKSMILIMAPKIIQYADLPSEIPTHFDAAGQADGFGGKGTLLVLPSTQ